MAKPNLIPEKNVQETLDTIESVAREVAFEKGEGTERMELYLHYAINCYLENLVDTLKEIKTVCLDITDHFTVALPKDFLDLVKIGYQYKDQILTFTTDDYIVSLKNDESQGAGLERTNSTIQDSRSKLNSDGISYVYFSNYYNELGEHKGRLFGLMLKSNELGTYKIDRAKREIYLSLRNTWSNKGKVVLEYIGLCTSATEATPINPIAKQMLKYYIYWQTSEQDKSIPTNKAVRYEDLYWREQKRVVARLSDLSVADIIEAARVYYSQTPNF